MQYDDFTLRLTRATPHVWVTPTLIALNVIVWLANLASGVDPIGPDPRALLLWGGNFLPATLEQPWRLFTATLLHGGMIHLALNMWALWDTGPIALPGKKNRLDGVKITIFLLSFHSVFYICDQWHHS